MDLYFLLHSMAPREFQDIQASLKYGEISLQINQMLKNEGERVRVRKNRSKVHGG